VLDAGCGLGHGLAALRRVWPQAQLEGVEWSRPLAWWAVWRHPQARVRRGDMWAASWEGLDALYVFQRPESMPRVLEKARREMPGAWLVSLEFEAPGLQPVARLGARPLWVYRIPRSISSGPRR
jgi:trans-aconitate methyltransferase